MIAPYHHNARGTTPLETPPEPPRDENKKDQGTGDGCFGCAIMLLLMILIGPWLVGVFCGIVSNGCSTYERYAKETIDNGYNSVK